MSKDFQSQNPYSNLDSNMGAAEKIAVLCGGVGAAKFLEGLKNVVPEKSITAILNTGDDMKHCGLYISPDIDTVIYTLAGEINPKTGWGLKKETWRAMEALQGLDTDLRYGWFNLGDRDIGTHLFRTARLAEGSTLSQITAEMTEHFGVGINILPMTDDSIQTKITLLSDSGPDSAPESAPISFQEYFVKLKHNVAVSSLHFEGAENATPAPGVLEALTKADKIIIAPSNPLLSISPILSLKEIHKAISARRRDTIFISPIVGGKALKGPADRLLAELGYIPDAAGVAKFYSDIADRAVIDIQDADLLEDVEALGLKCVVLDTIMSSPKKSTQLAKDILAYLSDK